jgi:hypothetical protein
LQPWLPITNYRHAGRRAQRFRRTGGSAAFGQVSRLYSQRTGEASEAGLDAEANFRSFSSTGNYFS